MLPIVSKFTSMTKNASSGKTEQRPIWLVMSPIGSYWPGMAKSMREIPVFAESIERSKKIMKEVNFDLDAIVYDENRKEGDFLENMSGILAIQMAITDCLYSMGLKPDAIFGHSLGEVGAGYADGSISARQGLLTAHNIVAAASKKHKGKGALALVGLSRKEAQKRCPPGVYVACNNASQHVGIAGLAANVKLFVHHLQSQGVMAVWIDSDGIPLHTPLVEDCRNDMIRAVKPFFPEPKKRSPRWKSTSIPQAEWATASPYADGEYYANLSIVETAYYEITQTIPDNAIVIEVGPDCQMVNLMKKDLSPGVTLVPLLQGHNNGGNLDLFVSGLAKIHNSGHKLDISKLFEK
ncbi:Fatty acid synthase [Halotydeus destructor]|nr:Fatty acid synthase [Halotydeus destructor]